MLSSQDKLKQTLVAKETIRLRNTHIRSPFGSPAMRSNMSKARPTPVPLVPP